MAKYKLGRIAGLSISARPPAITGSVVLFLVLIGIAVGILRLQSGEAIVGSLAAVVLHWLAALTHQVGHFWAARKTGYPMIGMRLGNYGLLIASLYPNDEPDLPAAVHIRRALGGPTGSFIASLVAGGIAMLLRHSGEALWWVAIFFFLDHLFVFTLGSLLPLGFTDGSTLLAWWGKR